MIAQADVLLQSRTLLQREAILKRTTIKLVDLLLLDLQGRPTKEVTTEVLPKHTAQVRAVAEAVSLEVLEAAEAENEETNIGFK